MHMHPRGRFVEATAHHSLPNEPDVCSGISLLEIWNTPHPLLRPPAPLAATAKAPRKTEALRDANP